MGRNYQQTFPDSLGIDTYPRVATAKLYAHKNTITAADLLNDRVVPFFDAQGIRLNRVLTDRAPSASSGAASPRTTPTSSTWR